MKDVYDIFKIRYTLQTYETREGGVGRFRTVDSSKKKGGSKT